MSTLESAIVDTPASRAVLHNPQNFFNYRLPPVARHQFTRERDLAFAHQGGPKEIELSISDVLGTPYPATTPLLLARYLCLDSGDSLSINRLTSGEVFYVLSGAGVSSDGADVIRWGVGDVFSFPGGTDVIHEAETRTILFSVCNEPLLRFERLQAPAPGTAAVRPVHWPHGLIESSLDEIYARANGDEASGRAVQLSSGDMAPAMHTLPSMNVAINTLQSGGDQRPHRHNGVAITLAVKGGGVHSMIEDQRIDWLEGAAQITPATELHSHHNRGSERMYSLVVQDEGLHFYTRTPGFSWT
jgi:gentisate 1,2-dioxygenase